MNKKRTVKLYGSLAKKYGSEHKLCGNTIQVLMSGINNRKPGFKNTIANNRWQVVVGDKDKGLAVTETNSIMNLSGHDEIHIMPEVVGASGVIQSVVGVVLIVAGAITGNPYLMAAGGGLLVSGLITPATISDPLATEEVDQRPSFMFNGAVNVAEQGGPVPLVFGKMRSGSTVISAGISAESWGEWYNDWSFKWGGGTGKTVFTTGQGTT